MIAAALLASAVLAGARCLDDTRRANLVGIEAAGGRLTAVIDPAHGANLVGLELDGRELLYRGLNFCPVTGWDGKAPVLWPATGRNYVTEPSGGEAVPGWTIDGRRYPMPIHGFARDRPWRVVKKSANSVTVELADDAVTRSFYPFGFRLRLSYTLARDGISLDHEVVAEKRQAPMPFSIGNHVTFAIDPDATVSTGLTRRILLDADGRPAGSTIQPALDRASVSGFARLSAVSLAGYDPVARAKLELGRGVQVRFSQTARGPRPQADPVRYNLWGDPAAGYFAVEPWYGRQNALAEGRGIVFLPPGQRFDWRLTMKIANSTAPTRN